MPYDILLRGGRVVDPRNDTDGLLDIAIEGGRVAEVAPAIAPTAVRQVIDAAGLAVLPGLVDAHTHVSKLLGGSYGFRMLALAGVTTAVDCAGPLESVLTGMARAGAGINVAVINAAAPGRSVGGSDPAPAEIEAAVARMLDEGAFGVKLMGGHYPLTPDATAGFIAEANRQRCYVAYHAGTTRYGSNYHGFTEALELAGPNAMHLAHINAYCRGVATGDPIAETRGALAALETRPRIASEFHLATINGTSGHCIDGVPESHVTRTCLRMGGYPETQAGLAAAFRAGYALVTADTGGTNVLLSGPEGLAYWQANQAVSTVGFPVNNRTTAFLCAAGRRKDGGLVLTALTTDGGGIPRNFLLQRGLLLVEFDLWSLPEYVTMVSSNPARMLGLPAKGHLAAGADADITVVDLRRRRAALTIVGGRVVMSHGVVTGSGGQIITTARGAAALAVAHVPHQVADMETSLLYAK